MDLGSNAISILLIDDDEDDYVMLKNLLSEANIFQLKLDWVSTYHEGREILLKNIHNACFIDYRLSGQTGLDLLKDVTLNGCVIPIILLTGYGETAVDLEAMKLGAADYMIKDQISPFLLERSIRYSIYRNKVMKDLRTQEESIRSLFNATFEGILMYDQNFKILDANQTASQIFGYEKSQIIGAHVQHFFWADHWKKLKPNLEQADSQSIEVTGLKSDKHTIALEISSKTYQHAEQSVKLMAIRDISTRKQLEAQVLVQDRLASIGLLASSLAHEVGTPLGVIRGRAEMLSRQLSKDANIEKNLQAIISQIDRVSGLIKSLLNLARGDHLKDDQTISLNQVVNDVTDLMSHELKKNEIELINHISEKIDLTIKGDAKSLHQVILNLMVNSVHAIQVAKKNKRESGHFILIDLQKAPNHFTLVLQDSGCGISAQNLKNIFKPFFTTKEIGQGTGLGLAISYRIVESWGGTIEVESQENTATTFKINLPRGCT